MEASGIDGLDYGRLSRPAAMGIHERDYMSMRLFKRGKSSRNWEVQFRDAQNIIRRLSLFSDKTASQEAGRKIVKLVALRMAGEAPDAALVNWLDICPQRILERMAEWDIIDNRRVVSGKPLTGYVDDWREAMEANHFAKRYISCSVNIVLRCIRGCGWKTVVDISRDDMAPYLKTLSSRGRSLDTLNHQIRCVKAFCNWLIDTGRITINPFTRYPMYNAETDRRKVRRALTMDELLRLFHAAESGVFTKGLTGHQRNLIYRLAVSTGLRWNEIRSLSIASFSLSGTQPSVTLQAQHAKNKEAATQFFHRELADQLKAHYGTRSDSEKAFPGMCKDKAAAMIRHDLKRAGIPYKDGLGRAADFHALRHTCGTLLCKAGVPLTTAQKIMRHSDPKLTANIYNHVEDSDKAEAIAKIPGLFGNFSTEAENPESATRINLTDLGLPLVKNVNQPHSKNALTHEKHVRKTVRTKWDRLRNFGSYRETESRTSREKMRNIVIQDGQEKTRIPLEDTGLEYWHPGRESNPYLQLRRLSPYPLGYQGMRRL